MKFLFTLLLIAAVASTSYSQIYVPSGTAGVLSSSTANIGIGTSAPADQLDVVLPGNRRVTINGLISGVSPGGLISLTRAVDGLKTIYIGVAPHNGTYSDNVIAGVGGFSELRFVSGGLNSAGFGFYNNMTATDAFAATRPTTPVMKIDKLGNLGVGIASPVSRLHVIGNGGSNVDFRVNGRIQTGDSSRLGGIQINGGNQQMMVGAASATSLGLYNHGIWGLVVLGDGKVGINNINPTAALQVTGAGATGVDVRTNGRIQTGDANNNGGIWLNNPATMLVGQASGTQMGFSINSVWRMVLDNAGNVGIGTTAPDAMLTVKGKVHAKEVKVDLTGALAPDYVFDKNYALPSLEKVKEYIDKNHHLPEIPSAEEIDANGFELGEMNLLLLKKIEELTLYIIEQEKRIERLESKAKE